jgi:hypothetical protein
MLLNKINAEIPQEQETQVIQYVKDIKSLLPFLVGLNSKDRRRLAKLSRRRVDMVDRSFIHATQLPGYLPSFVTPEGFKKEVDLRDCLQRIGAEIDSLKEKIDDTILLVGSEAYRSARLFYKTVKAAAREGAEDAERIAKDISYHFKKKTTSENNTDNPDNKDNTDSIDTDRTGNYTPEPPVEIK